MMPQGPFASCGGDVPFLVTGGTPPYTVLGILGGSADAFEVVPASGSMLPEGKPSVVVKPLSGATPGRYQVGIKDGSNTQRSTEFVVVEPRGCRAVTTLADILFDFNESVFRADLENNAANLDAIVALLEQQPTLVIRLDGHADPRGSRKYNLTLSQKRALAVRERLVARGIKPDRNELLAESFDRVPPCPKELGTDKCFQLRRRVEILGVMSRH
jgi:outer membrane protein OmpA-like peptidoglycan-associated protein